MRRLKLLGTHIVNAERLAAQMRAAREKTANLENMIDRLGLVAFITDRNGKILHMTEAAEDFLGTGAVFRVAGGCLACRDSTLEPEFKAALRLCAESIDRPGREAGRMACVSGPDHGAR